jgi:hypothetical protein
MYVNYFIPTNLKAKPRAINVTIKKEIVFDVKEVEKLGLFGCILSNICSKTSTTPLDNKNPKISKKPTTTIITRKSGMSKSGISERIT